MSFETDFSQPRSSWKGRQLGKIRFEVEGMDSRLRRTEKPWGDWVYFLVHPKDSDHVISFPQKYWPPTFQIGDTVEVETEISRYNPEQAFVTVSNFKDAMKPNILERGTAVPDGEYENVIIETEYISTLKDRDGGQFQPHYIAYGAKASQDGITDIWVYPAALYNPDPDEDDLSWEDLQYATIDCNGDKKGSRFEIRSINKLVKKEFKQGFEIRFADLNFVDNGATFDVRQNLDNDEISYTGFISDEEFPFESSTLVNKVKELYPEEFSHTVGVYGEFNRYERKKRDKGVWKTKIDFHLDQDKPASLSGLDLPTIADGMKRVTDSFYAEQKYKDAVKALRQMKGYMTYNRASSAFSNLGLSFTEDEYYREIESRLMKKHKNYDRGFFEIMREYVDDINDAEWGGNTETGQFVAIFPDQELIMVELPVPGSASYFYRIHAGVSVEDMLARINLASPHNGIKRHLLWQNKTFKESLVKVGVPDPNNPGKDWGEVTLKQLVDDGVISNENEGLRSWTGYIGKAVHRSYDNYKSTLDWFLETAPKLVMTGDGYKESTPTRRNPGFGTLFAATAAPIISGAVAATASFFIGRMWERKENQTGIDAALQNLSAQQNGKLEKMLENGFRIMTITDKRNESEERAKVTKQGLKAHSMKSGDIVIVLGEPRKNGSPSTGVVKTYKTFHDQPHKNVVKRKVFDKNNDSTILGPLKHIIYFCSKWSEDEAGKITDEQNVDIHYIHEWNEEGDTNDAGRNCMWVAKSNKTDDYILLGDADVQDVGITDATYENDAPEKLLAKYQVPEELAWLGECKEIAYIDSNGKKKIVRFKNKSLACADDRKQLFIVDGV
jgi:hypothetical protein